MIQAKESFTTFEVVKGRKEQVVVPDYVNEEALQFSENSLKVLERRYLRRDVNGTPLETTAGMFYRVASWIASVEEQHGGGIDYTTKVFYKLLTELRFLPNSPTFTGAATPLGQLAACFVLPISDDMGREDDGIFSTLRVAALIQQTGGGNGFSFSRLRPRGDIVHASAGRATGPVGFLRVYDQAFGEIAQGGTRRGANMGVLRVDHPDIEEFIECKTEEGDLANFNISVAITDEFMQAVKDDENFNLRNPRNDNIVRTVKARELFNKIVKHAHRNGEPGALFIDAANRSNPVPHLYDLEATNPCGEQWLGPYENCCLGSINLAAHVTTFSSGKSEVDWHKLKITIRDSTHFLDNVVSVNAYLPAVPAVRDAALKARRIGLGIMGLGDMMYKMEIRYGSKKGQEFAAQVMEFVRYHCMERSIELAKERGPFLSYRGSIYFDGEFDAVNEGNLHWRVPVPSIPYQHSWKRPSLNWNTIVSNLLRHGIRNAAQTTVAPTGTISTVSGCEGYGCEPVFALGYTRHFKDGDDDVELAYTSPLFEEALDRVPHMNKNKKEMVRQEVARVGSCQHLVEELPLYIRDVFVVSSDITADEHVKMQAAIQTFVDNSISKTCNFPEGATEEDVAKTYMQAWESGCKGLTVYVTGSRDSVVLETQSTKEAKRKDDSVTLVKRPRPYVLNGRSYRKETPLGNAYITINSDDEGEPFEVFVNIGKAGSDVTAVSESIGRLISLILRISSELTPSERLNWIVDEMESIGGGRPMGFGNGRVKSLPDGVAQVLTDHLVSSDHLSEYPLNTATVQKNTIGDLCPDCGEASFISIEGCRKCHVCGYSEC